MEYSGFKEQNDFLLLICISVAIIRFFLFCLSQEQCFEHRQFLFSVSGFHFSVTVWHGG